MNPQLSRTQELEKLKRELNESSERIKNVGRVNETNFSDYLVKKQEIDKNRRKRDEIARKINNIASQNEHTFRFYHSNYKGKAAIIADIINREINPPRADYGVDLIELAIEKMKDIDLPEDFDVQYLVETKNSFRESAINAYNQAVRDTDGKTDTQLGLRADFISYQ